MERQCLFVATAKHVAQVFTDEGCDDYLGYFQNVYGERFVFRRRRGATMAELFGDDLSWTEPVQVSPARPCEVILSDAERAWVAACWSASAAIE